MIGNGIYSFSEAARLTGLSSRRVRAWFCGEQAEGRRLIYSDYSPAKSTGGQISFHDLIDTLVVGKFRRAGLSLQYLRKVHEALLAEFEVDHPFCWKKLLTDGKRVFVHTADEIGEEHLKELLSRQHAFPEILAPVLKQIEYDPTSLLARRWNIAQGIIIDPGRQRGKPLVESAGIPTAVLDAAYEANGRDLAIVAHWYGVSQEDVRLAVAFEHGIRSAA
jgi:uncharacterized protein (DUF433 family)